MKKIIQDIFQRWNGKELVGNWVEYWEKTEYYCHNKSFLYL
jgi:hypothetical protein